MRGTDKYEWVRQKYQRAPVIVDTGAEMTADVGKIDAAMREHWTGIWESKPRNRPLENALLSTLGAHEECAIAPLSADSTSEAARKLSGVSGPCGWGAQEIRACKELYGQLALVYGAWEAAGRLPTCALSADVTMVPKKNEAIHYTSMRPISVCSALLRLYTTTRLQQDIFRWQENIIGRIASDCGLPDLANAGCRKERGCQDLVTPLAVAIERGNAELTQTRVISYDLAKAFDTLPFDVTELPEVHSTGGVPLDGAGFGFG